MNDQLLVIVEPEVLSWPGVTSEPNRFGAPESDHTQGSYNPLAAGRYMGATHGKLGLGPGPSRTVRPSEPAIAQRK
jgi:hypothetical protein